MSTPTVQEIVTTSWPAVFRTAGSISTHTRRVMNALMLCRSALLGSHRHTCSEETCGHSILAHNSCRNRHCPTCQALARAEWLTRRLEDLLPVHYFHLVLTLPRELRALTRRNKRAVYRMMFKAASETILTLCGDPKRLGGIPGLILMLHTWTQRLTFHPHLHGIIPGGVLTPDRSRWIAAGEKFFLPVDVVSAMFRGKMLAFLKEAHAAGELAWDADAFRVLITQLYSKRWHVYLERSFRNPIRVVKYLAAYTNRVAIADKRILSLDKGMVRYRYLQRGKHSKSPAVERIPATEFTTRFMLHILPPQFVKIRYYGLLSNRSRADMLTDCLVLLEKAVPLQTDLLRTTVAAEMLKAVSRLPGWPCPVCGIGQMSITDRLAPALPLSAAGGND